ncbi:hypothetical protein [Mobiluncus porci]|uniref:Polysaccharide biosynthesis protein n=1 Tax=Mobiluncus porci TaxID=2652278 RepID=A0A7K0K4V6_9ACTO|nr:hypothetical protein [Mobiluncus porci]MST50065.1 hypothetical protein [Mobiluncus porci]
MRRLGIIGVALVTASLLGIVLLVGVARWLSPDENAAFIALWGVLFAGGSALSLVEQETARQSTRADAEGKATPISVAQLALVALGLSWLLLMVMGFTPAGSALFASAGSQGGQRISTVGIMALAYLGFVAQFSVRGLALGRRQEGIYAAILVAEPVWRLLGLLPFVLWAADPSPLWALLATAAGSYGWVVAWRRVRLRPFEPNSSESWGRVTGRVVLLGAANGLLAALLTGYPALVTVMVGSSQGLAVFFAVVTLCRIPLVLLAPVQALVIPETTRILAAGRARSLFGLLGKVLAATLGVAIVSAVAGWALGPWAVRLLFGSSYVAPGWLVALILASTVVLGAALLQAAVFVSLERYLSSVLTWGATLAGTVVALLVTPGDALARGTAGFVVASVLGYVISGLLLRLALGRVAGRSGGE